MTLLTARKNRNKITRQAKKAAKKVVKVGEKLGSKLAPELYEPEGLGRLDANKYTDYLDESKASFQNVLDQFEGVNADVMARRESALEGLNSAENTALRERAYAGVDRSRQAAMSDLLAAQAGGGLGGGANFAQQRAVARDFDRDKGRLEQDLLLSNIDIKRQALGDYEASNRGAFDVRAGIAGTMDTLGQRGAETQRAVDQFNLDQLQREIAAKTAIMNTGSAIFKDEQDRILAEKKLQDMLAFIRDQEASKYAQIRGIL